MPLSTSPAIVLLAHGSRDPQWRQPIEAVAAQIRTRQPGTVVVCTYLEMCEPRLPDAVAALIASGTTAIRVLPLFLGLGKHAREDLPRLLAAVTLAHPGVSIELLPTVGENEAVLALIAQTALDPS